MQHLDEGFVHAWLDGALSVEEAAGVEAHVASCDQCRALVAEARGLVAASSRIVSALDVTPGAVLPAFGARPRRRWSVVPWAAGIAATLVVAIGFQVLGRVTETQFKAVSTPAPASQSADSVAAAPPAIVAAPAPSATVPSPSPATSPSRANAERRSVTQSNVPAKSVRAEAAKRCCLEPTTATVPAAAAAIMAARDASLPTEQARAAMSAASVTATAANTLVDSIGRVARKERAVALADVRDTNAAPPPATRNPVVSILRADSLARQRIPMSVGGTARAVGAGGGRGGRGGSGNSVIQLRSLSERIVTAQSFVGCYELSESTDILPRRFALRVDSVPAWRGLFAVLYIDSAGKPADRIQDAGWLLQSGLAVIETAGRGAILSVTRTDSTVIGQSISGPRTGRVTPCR